MFFRRKEKGEGSADKCRSGGWRQEKGVQTNAAQEEGEGEGSADKCRSGGWRKGKGWQCETDLREEWLKRTVERVDLGPYG